MKRYFTLVETADREIAIVTVDGRVKWVVEPARRVLYWRDAATVTIERLGPAVTAAGVEEGRVALLFINSRFVRTLEPGRYGFWTAANPRIEMVDMRRQTLEIPGQKF